MSFTDAQKELVQSGFVEVAVQSDHAANLFYDRLFETAPATKDLFKKTDMKSQGQKLMQTLAVVINGLDQPDQVIGAVRDLGKRHVNYGVKAEDYQSVGQALLWMLEQELGEKFTAEAKEAWTAIYTLVANTAIEAAYPPSAPSPAATD